MSDTLKRLVATCYRFKRYAAMNQGVLNSEEALQQALETKRLIIHSSVDEKIFFFSDNHCFGYEVLPSHFVPCTAVFPLQVWPRDSLPDGWIRTIEQYIEVFCSGERQITSIEELVEYLDKEVQHG